MKENECPLCGAQEKCKTSMSGENGYVSFHCENFKVDYLLADNIINLDKGEFKEKIFDLIAEYLLHQKKCMINQNEYKWHFYYDPSDSNTDNAKLPYVNLNDLIKTYPENVLDIVNRSLLNLSALYPRYGDLITWFPSERRLLFEHYSNNTWDSGVLNILADLGYLKDPDNSKNYIISAEGWKKIDEIRKNNFISKQAFIAMQFGEKTKYIREAFRKAIIESGYSVRIIDEKEHNNQIVPEIFYEIEKSKFVVVDVTYPNYGAYYEAGYAQALGKEVIVCCCQEAFEDLNRCPHFDIAQKSMIIWKDEEELIDRLKRRIEATVR